MASKIVLKKSSVANKVPLATDLDYGEVALNYQDGRLFFKKANNTIDSFVSSTGVGASGSWGISITGNSGTATTLQNARTITIGNTGKTFNGSANVAWTTSEIGAEFQQTLGVPRNNLGDPTVREMALFDGQFNNKIERYDIANIFVETSTDNVSWAPFAITDAQKRILVGGDTSQSTLTIPYGTAYFRIRMRTTNYVYLNAFYSYWSANGHSTTVRIFRKHDLDANWTAVANSATTVSSWPGHLYLPHSTIPWHPSATQGTHYHEIYVEFQPVWNSSFPSNSINLYKVQWWGGYPAGKRNLYSTSEFGDALFPAAIAATGAITQGGNQVLHAGNYTSYALPLTGGTLTGTLSHTGLVSTDGTNVDQTKTITKSITMTTDWQDTGIKSTDLATGTYVVQLIANDTGSGGTNNNEYYSGTMSWYSGDTNSALEMPTDEIVLHRAGGSGDGALYLRTYRTPTANPDNLKLQIYSNTANASAANYVFKFRRII
jgi:hypothetical protein